jgi:hypothetical protein
VVGRGGFVGGVLKRSCLGLFVWPLVLLCNRFASLRFTSSPHRGVNGKTTPPLPPTGSALSERYFNRHDQKTFQKFKNSKRTIIAGEHRFDSLRFLLAFEAPLNSARAAPLKRRFEIARETTQARLNQRGRLRF